jgi:hypothetical protein
MRALLLGVVTLLLVAPMAASAADGEPRQALTKADQALARSVLLKRADLGAGFSATPRRKDHGLPKGARCDALDESDLTVTGDAASADFRFSQGPTFVTIGSTAQVYRTLREANASWSRGSVAQTTTCLADIVRLSAAPGQKITIVSSRHMAFPSVSPKTTAYRIVLTIDAGAQGKVRGYVDAVILQHGRVQSGVLFTSIGRPVGQADRVALATVVAARMAKSAGPKGPVA